MRTWRLTVADFIKDAFTGEGARIAGGRWNPKGIPVVYTASSLALAALELLVHAADDLLPDNLVSFAVDIPDDLAIEHLFIEDLPQSWRTYPPPEVLQEIGYTWSTRRSSAILAIPSVIIPEENNFLLNPLHADFNRIKLSSPQPFNFDARLQRSK